MSRKIDNSDLSALSADDLQYLSDRGNKKAAQLLRDIRDDEADAPSDAPTLDELASMEFQPLVEALDAIDKPGIIALTEAFNEAYVGEDEEALATSGKVAELRSTLADELANIEEA